MNIKAVDYIQYAVSDFGKSVAFYRDTLGLRESFRNDQWKWAEFDAGNVTLAFYQAENVQKGGGIVALAVDDIDATLQDLRSKGIRIEREPVSGDWCTQFSILDPDGHSIYIHRRKDGTCGTQ